MKNVFVRVDKTYNPKSTFCKWKRTEELLFDLLINNEIVLLIDESVDSEGFVFNYYKEINFDKYEHNIKTSPSCT